MLYLSCPTCGYFLGNKTMEFETKKDLICSNPKYDKAKQGEEIQKLLKSLKLRRYCCRMRMMTYKDIVHEIIPLPNE
jgi:DNA-directed RNA polymerase subunit N (RpoN/RPB10)